MCGTLLYYVLTSQGIFMSFYTKLLHLENMFNKMVQGYMSEILMFLKFSVLKGFTLKVNRLNDIHTRMPMRVNAASS